MLLLQSQHDKVIASSVSLACTAVHKPYVHAGDKLPLNILSLVMTFDTLHEPDSYVPTSKIIQCNACKTAYIATIQHGGTSKCRLPTDDSSMK